MNTHHKSLWARRASVPLAIALTAAALAGCATGSTPSGEQKQDPNAEITVWVDATRQPGVEAFVKDNPDVKVKVELYDPATLLTKIQLLNRTGKGWPDVIFDPVANDIASLASDQYDYAADITDVLSKELLDGFGTANDTCVVDEVLSCVKNDLAQTVLWYNKPLLEEFGYELPTTWDEYQELGVKVAEEHPGYIIGVGGNSYHDYFWGSGCPLQDVVDSTAVKINTADEKCTRVAKLLDPLIENGSISRFGPFSPETVALAKEGKILMMSGASWYGEFVFRPEGSYATPEGVLAAGANPTWAGESDNWSGAQGGGIWVVSRHSKNVDAAAAVVEYMLTDEQLVKTSPTYPAYGPAADIWAKRLESDTYYAENPFPVLQDAAGKINPAMASVRYSVSDAFNQTIGAAVKSGATVESGLEPLQAQLNGLAQSVGYAVIQ